MIENSIYLYLYVNYEMNCALKLRFDLCIKGLGVVQGGTRPFFRDETEKIDL